MSNLHILHFIAQGEDRPLPWTLDLTAQRIVFLKARKPAEAVALVRAYGMMMILVDLLEWNDEASAALTQLREALPDEHRPPIVGVLGFEPTCDQRRTLTAAQFDSLICSQDPDRFLLWQIDTLRHLTELSRFEQTRMDVSQLSHETRQKLHDLSQPLSALQGRLQLMSAKTPADDPNSQTFKELVRLIFDVSNQLMEIQRLHRTHS